MGSSKKHKKDREGSSRKHKKDRSRSPISPAYEQQRESSRDYRDRGEREYREVEYQRERRHKKHHHHKEKRHHRSRGDEASLTTRDRGERYEEYHSDSSDVIEVPIEPPAPRITAATASSSRKSRSASPIPQNGAGDVLSIEETNKLRAKLGLKPLEVESGPINKKSNDGSKSKPSTSSGGRKETNDSDLNQYKDDFGEFYHKPADNLAQKKQAEKIRDKLKERRQKRKVEEKLTKVKGLGESDSEDESATKWVKKNRDKEKMKAEADSRAKMLDLMEAEFGVTAMVEQKARDKRRQAYKDRDLSGLRVEHDVDQFDEDREVILTLKDKDVLAEEDDTLVNVNMIDDERYKKNVENRKLNPHMYGYNAYAEETVDEFGNIISRPILGKYDEEIEGGKKSSFTIGESVQDEIQQKRRLLEIKSKLQGKKLETLADVQLHLASEYMSAEEMSTKFKKPKKKVKKIRQKLKADDLLAMAAEEATSSKDLGSRKKRNRHVDQNPGGILTDDVPNVPNDFDNVKLEEEDDDLEKILSKARRLKQKEALIQKPPPIDTKMEVKSEPNSEEEDDAANGRDSKIVLDATAEFCRTLGDIPTYGLSGNRDEEANELMDFEAELEQEEMEQEEEESNVGVWSSVNPDAEREKSVNPIELSDVAILDEEPDVSSGVAGALRLAMSKGYLERDESNRPSGSRMAHLQAKNYSIEDKTYGGEDDKFGRRDRFHSGPTVDFREKETFKPNVKLEYIDDGGRLLNAKEAFRYLSHKFHGKGPGKNKIEKRLKKQEQDQLMMKMNSTDTPLGTLNMLQQKQKETQSPYIVLSGSKQTHANSTIVKSKMK